MSSIKIFNILVVEPFYTDHKRLILLTKAKLFQLKLLNFSLLLIDKGAGTKHWQKSEYQTVYNLIDCNLQQGKAISNKSSSDSSCRNMSTR